MTSAFGHFDLTGKSVLITGGATGIGLEMTRALAGAGATVMMAARREEVLKEAADTLMSEPGIGTVLWRGVDLTDRESVKSLSQHAIATMDGVDIFIGNAGSKYLERVDDITDAALEQQLRVNLTANIELTRDLIPHMRRNKWGRFIYSSSITGHLASADDVLSVYGAVKNGLNGFVKGVAAEGGRDGITANSLLLGVYDTAMSDAHLQGEAHEAYLADILSMTTLGRPGQPREIGGMVQLLASDAGSYITGACLTVDGGMSAALRPSSVVKHPPTSAPVYATG